MDYHDLSVDRWYAGSRWAQLSPTVIHMYMCYKENNQVIFFSKQGKWCCCDAYIAFTRFIQKVVNVDTVASLEMSVWLLWAYF